MGEKRSSWEPAARDAAEAVARAREAGEQLALFGGPQPAEPEPAWDGKGRKPGARNRGKVGLAEYMAAQGWRAPGEALAQAAGLAERGDGLEIAFRRALWLQEAALGALEAADPNLSGAERAAVQAAIARDLMAMTVALWKEQNAAADKLLPYTLQRLAPLEAAKPDAPPAARIGIAPASAAVGPVRPQLLPADLRAQGNQGLGEDVTARPDGRRGEDDASD